jgi:hypothetical protein
MDTLLDAKVFLKYALAMIKSAIPTPKLGWGVVLIVVILLSFLAPTRAQVKPAAIDEYNIPAEIDTCMKTSPKLALNGQINPFYLSGDFDGDGKLDFAVQVERSGSRGILICLSSRKLSLLVGAGSSVIWPSNQEWRFDAWSIVPKESTKVSRPAKANHDAILLDVKESANGLLYWDGTGLRWKQLGD